MSNKDVAIRRVQHFCCNATTELTASSQYSPQAIGPVILGERWEMTQPLETLRQRTLRNVALEAVEQQLQETKACVCAIYNMYLRITSHLHKI